MRIEHLMKPVTHTVKPHDTVAHARALIEEHRINQLPVVVNRKLVGIVTDRDLRDAPRAIEVSATAAAKRSVGRVTPEKISVEAVMTANVLTLSPADTVEKAARTMRRERIGAIPIVDKDTLVGIITRSDVLDVYIAGCRRKTAETAKS